MSEQLDEDRLRVTINDLGLIIMVNESGEYEVKFMGKDGRIYYADYYPQGYPEGTEYHDVDVHRVIIVQTWLRK